MTRGSQTFAYTYLDDGLLDSVVSPTGRKQAYTYDNDGQLKTVSAGPSTGSLTLQATYTYTGNGMPNTAVMGDGSTTSYSYDHDDRLTRILDTKSGGTKILDDTYTLDNVGNATQITHASGASDAYTYDTLDRLTGVCYATTTCTGATDYVKWTYDNVGNRTSEIRPTGTTSYAYDTATGLLSSTNAPGGAVTSYTYDARGDQLSAGNTTNTYNDAGRLATTSQGGTTTTFSYDGDGRRLSAATGTTTANFLWDPATYELDAETNGSGATVRDYTYGIGAIGFTPASGGNYYYHRDIQGSVREVTDTSGVSQTRAEYEPYGVVRSSSNIVASPPANPMGWLSQYSDATGNSHLRARQYDPTTGAFTTPDPAGATSASATFTYADANPMTMSDTTGLFSLQTAGTWLVDHSGEIAAVAGIAAMAFPIAAPILGPIALGFGAINAANSIASAVNTCTTSSQKGACAHAILGAAINTAAAIPGGKALSAFKGLSTEERLIGGATNELDDNVVLVRGGTNTAEQFANGSGVTVDTAGNLSGVSVNSGETVEQAAKGIPHNQIGVSTVGDVRQAGGNVTLEPTPSNANHCLISGCSADVLSDLFTPTIKNPGK